MKFRWPWFNLYLLAPLAVALGAGCKTSEPKEESTLRLHLEATPSRFASNLLAVVDRAHPFPVQVEKEPFLYENNVASAKVVDARGGFEIEVQLDQKGSWLLEQYTTANKTRRIVVFSMFGQPRWLAAPVITRRISDGNFSFTPDATREEAERIVRGLNRVAKLVDTGRR